jgi:hypothetical protein
MKAKTPKPRNPYVQHLLKKKSGAHTKTHKADRAREKATLKKEIRG